MIGNPDISALDLVGHFPHRIAPAEMELAAECGGKIVGKFAFFTAAAAKEFQMRAGKPAETLPCTNCGKPDPTKPFGSVAHQDEELGGM